MTCGKHINISEKYQSIEEEAYYEECIYSIYCI